MRRAFSVAVFARNPQGRILLVRHKRLNTWLPPGGEIEAGETPLEAAARELKEETGLVARFVDGNDGISGIDGAPRGLIAYEEHDAGSKGLHMNFCFAADVEGEVVPCEEFTDYAWIDDVTTVSCPKNVAQLVALASNRSLSSIARGRDGGASPPAPALAFREAELQALARAWLARFNARDLDGLLALYDDDAVHVSPKLRDKRPETRGEIRGKSALREWWADAFARIPGLRYEERSVTASHDSSSLGPSSLGRVFLEYVRHAPGEADLLVAESYVVRGGRIVESRVFHG